MAAPSEPTPTRPAPPRRDPVLTGLPSPTLVFRQVDYWATVFRRTWKGGVVSSLLVPVLYVLAMGVLLGGYVAGGPQLDGAPTYLIFVAPGLVATHSMNIAFSEAAWPVMGMLTWDRVYEAMAASPLRPVDIHAGQLVFILFRVLSTIAVFMAVLSVVGVYASVWSALAAFAVQGLIGLAFAAAIFAYTAWLKTDTGLSVLYRLAMVPLFLFSGAFFPVSALAAPLQVLAMATPLYHGVELTRMGFVGRFDLGPLAAHLSYLVAMVLIGWVVGARLLARRVAS